MVVANSPCRVQVPRTPDGPYAWDVRVAAAEAYRLGQPLHLVFYSPDREYHSGKYFYTSDSTDWGGLVRPSLEVRWGDGGPGLPSAPTGLRLVPSP